MSATPYTKSYYAGFTGTSLPSAHGVLPWLLQQFPVTSVVDVGCGDGTWLSVVRQQGVERVLGLDGAWVSPQQLLIPASQFRSVSLEETLPDVGRFDLALNLEVAEHLSPARAPGLVEDLCRLAPLIAFSAAIPGQGGAHHVNEQWPGFWSALFLHHGYHAFDCLRPQFWNLPEVTWCYKQNMLLFAGPEALERWPGLHHLPRWHGDPPLPLVHPERFQLYQAAGVGFWLRAGWPALRRTLSRRLGRR